jgi:hypothetical protein
VHSHPSLAGVPTEDQLLHFDRAAQCIDDAGEFDQQPVSRCFDQAGRDLGDRGVDDLGAD